jgi:hypothetical protein
MLLEFAISHSPEGFEEYLPNTPIPSMFDSEESLVEHLTLEEGFVELGSDAFFDEYPDDEYPNLDITGLVLNEPDRVFVRLRSDGVPGY